MKNDTHIDYIDLCRFWAALEILFFHLGVAPILGKNGFLNGGLFVEFFFLLSGYFSVNHIGNRRTDFQENPEVRIFGYVKKKYFSFLPYSITFTILLYIYSFIKNSYSFTECIKRSFMLPFEAFLMRNTGINLYGIAGTLWYISAMLIVLPIVLFFVVKKKNIFKYYAAWIIPLFIYGYIIRQIGTIRTTDWVLSTLRAFAGLSLGGGIILYYRFFMLYSSL